MIHNYPETAPVFLEFGFTLIQNPLAQRVFARSISLEQACRLKHVDFFKFHAALTSTVDKHRSAPDGFVQIITR